MENCDRCWKRYSPSESGVCPSCYTKLVQREKDLKAELADQLKTELERTFQSKVAFLQLHHDSDLAEEIPKDFDVKIIVDNQEDKPLLAHMFVLANRSSVFRRMLATAMVESETRFIRIEDATLPVIRAVIRFCYKAEIDFTPEVTAEEVLRVAHKYAIGFLQQTCEEVLAKSINHVNLPKLLAFAKKFEANVLKEKGLKYLRDHFDSVIDVVVDELF